MAMNKTQKENLQFQAVEHLAIGDPIGVTAAKLNVGHNTISDWYNNDEIFKAKLEKRIAELQVEYRSKIKTLIPEAICSLQELLHGKNATARLGAIALILKHTKVIDAQAAAEFSGPIHIKFKPVGDMPEDPITDAA